MHKLKQKYDINNQLAWTTVCIDDLSTVYETVQSSYYSFIYSVW